MDYDKIENINGSIIQYGKNSDRVYLMKFNPFKVIGIIDHIDKLVDENNFGKIFAKIPVVHKNFFLTKNYEVEAMIPNFFNGREDCCFVSKFTNPERKKLRENEESEIQNNISFALTKKNSGTNKFYDNLVIREIKREELTKLTELYKTVFATYPFPIYDENYLESTMEHIEYYGIFEGEKLIAASSSEMSKDEKNVEMTDFATHPDSLGKSLSSHLLKFMDKRMMEKGFITSYTIARAFSKGMNITFAKNNYNFAGTLINNTHIYGKIESMNVWYKNLKD